MMRRRQGGDGSNNNSGNGARKNVAGNNNNSNSSGDDLAPSVTVFVKSAQGSEIASKLSGYFVVKGQEFRFNGIAFGRIGGHNASVKIPKSTLAKIAKMGIDTEELQLTIQRKLIEGDVILPDGLKPPS